MILKTIILIDIIFGVWVCQCIDETLIMNRISRTFGDHVLACQEQDRFSDEIVHQFLNYWNGSYSLNDRNMGCVFNCVLDRLNLAKPGGELEEANIDAFVTAKGSDKLFNKALIHLVNMCKNITKVDETCLFMLEVARCFRTGVQHMNVALEMDALNADDDYND